MLPAHLKGPVVQPAVVVRSFYPLLGVPSSMSAYPAAIKSLVMCYSAYSCDCDLNFDASECMNMTDGRFAISIRNMSATATAVVTSVLPLPGIP